MIDTIPLAVLLNALLPGAGHLLLRRWTAAALWLVVTIAAYLGGVVLLVAILVRLHDRDWLWQIGELRLLALFLLPAVLVHTSCCVAVLPDRGHRRLALVCAAAAMLLLIVFAPAVDVGLRRSLDQALAPR